MFQTEIAQNNGLDGKMTEQIKQWRVKFDSTDKQEIEKNIRLGLVRRTEAKYYLEWMRELDSNQIENLSN